MAADENQPAFDDADQLGDFLNDSKSFDKLRKSSIADARAAVDVFRNDGNGGAWPSLDKGVVADRLLELIGPESSDASDQPDSAGRLIQQGAMNLCGPAAFFQFVIKRDPVAFANFSCGLYGAGTATIGSLSVTPGDDIRLADYSQFLERMGGAVCPQADWMVMGALRNATNAFWTGSFQGSPEEVLAAGTRPGELAGWLSQTGLNSNVLDEANWMQSAGIPHATNLPTVAGSDVAALINADLIRAARNLPPQSSWPLTEFPNHWVIVLGETATDVTRDAVFFNIWTWGEVRILEVPTQAFVDNYYGAITCTLNQST